MARYSVKPEVEGKAAKAKGAYLRVHYKNLREVAFFISGMTPTKAKKVMGDILTFKGICPVTKYTGGVGHHAQAKQFKVPGNKGRWPQKATRAMLDILKNAEANAEAKGLDATKLKISHIQCNRAPTTRRRTYRAHGRIGPYMAEPGHVNVSY